MYHDITKLASGNFVSNWSCCCKILDTAVHIATVKNRLLGSYVLVELLLKQHTALIFYSFISPCSPQDYNTIMVHLWHQTGETFYHGFPNQSKRLKGKYCIFLVWALQYIWLDNSLLIELYQSSNINLHALMVLTRKYISVL